MSIRKFVDKWHRSIAKRVPGIHPPVATGNRRIEKPHKVRFSLPTLSLSEIFSGCDNEEVAFLPRLIRTHKWAMPEHELITLGAITKVLQPRLVVEFGTFLGGSTLVFASNMPERSKIITFDIDPSARKTHIHGMGVGVPDFDLGCLFRGTRYERMIEQRYSNELNFYDKNVEGQADLVFVDADHTYDFVKKDTQLAVRFLKPGGSILWHDYTWELSSSECVGVTQAVNEFHKEVGGCYQIAGTRFAIYTPSLVANRSRTTAA
ncbi:MAG: class I SAM-dependent methyltransferase [Planctomycetes bacterium]|nr:class I SAM-dependent methyltransferase [Planctomycetota bacterium]